MFPIEKQYLLKYHTEGNVAATMYKAIIDKNTTEIVNACQKYLNDYEAGIRPQFSTDIDYLTQQLIKSGPPV